MGLALGIGKGYQFADRLALTDGELYIRAANADGYTGGSKSCFQEFFNVLKSIETLGFIEARTYINSSSTESYTGGSVLCGESFYSDLESISNVFFLIKNNQWNDNGIWSDNANWIG